jgi:Tol biopolymer transport system component
MTTQATTQKAQARGKRRSAVLASLVLGAVLSGALALAGVAQQAEATFPGTNARIAFVSERTTGTGVDNPTGDPEIFTINPDGTGLKQLTFNTLEEYSPIFSPDGTKIVYTSRGDDTSNPQRDCEVYVMSSLDGTGKVNLTNNGTYVNDYDPKFSPDGQWIAYESRGTQTSNPEGDGEVYRMNALDGTGQINLSNNGSGVSDGFPVYSPGGTRIAYYSSGIQTSNPQGDGEVYRMNTLDGTGKRNLSNNGSGVNDYFPIFSPDGTKIAYYSEGIQTSNPQGDREVYRMNASDGLGKKNLSNNDASDSHLNWGRQAM